MSNNPILIVGSSGAVGKQIVRQLLNKGSVVIAIPSKQLLSMNTANTEKYLLDVLAYNNIEDLSSTTLGLILAHRCRSADNLTAITTEIRITRDFVWLLSDLCFTLRVMVLGSITGSRVNLKQPEAYHYSKDLQKSIVRQSIRVQNLYMNLLELNWFQKYSIVDSTLEYRQILSDLCHRLEGSKLPSVGHIADFVYDIINCSLPPRGQTIVYDCGLSLLQND